MSWHYAARKRKDGFGGYIYDLVEVHDFWVTENAVTVSGESLEELALGLQIAADEVMRRKVIDESDEG